MSAAGVGSATRVAVIGGGVIGTAVARELTRRVPGAAVTLVEKEDRLAAHQTGHNSGVVHAGLYYEPGSLKARLCRRGVGLLQDFAQQHGIAYEECGKVVVARTDQESARLDALHERAVANGVPGVRIIGPAQLREIEPWAVGRRALHSPHTAIVDYPAVTAVLGAELAAAGGTLLLGQQVTGLSTLSGRSGGVRLRTDAGLDEPFDLVIACAGLQSDRVARLAGDAPGPRIVPFFGDYALVAADQRDLVRGLIYPVPDPRYPFLGVHLTRRVDGEVMVGPNAFLSLGRESYQGGRPVGRDLRDAVGFGGFWRFAAGNVPAAVREAGTAVSRRRFVAGARAYVPALDAARMRPGPRGIRAQAMDDRGRLVDDFVITGSERMVHVRNAPSPGATSALAIAEHVVSEALQRSGLRPTTDERPHL
ncbi:L-2-hydroxyglutarate oxidase [Nocardioides mesophilus]|uniref:L-2-hydroxyglutarate oxidase n=1 Tax=Nocardioides mesophilus TaxID=433659 RepID=A0A7G9R9L8_9ACTN|nr:L-2-hydroxyglutarate oxidase [Nocardioides mesophilus]QNN52293.1 L-2-hydroxyglutarate oxidase [Nocardioides mesophilus]